MSEIRLNEQEGGVGGFWHRYRLLIIVAAIAAAVIGWLYMAKEDALKAAQEAAAAERVKVAGQAEAQHAATLKRSLNLLGVPLAWALRREMMAGNLDQVDQYVGELVRLEGVHEVVVANADGVIAVASDRRHAGAAFATLYPERYLSSDEIVVDEVAAGRWLLVAPLMGLSGRLGTVVLGYQPPPFALGE